MAGIGSTRSFLSLLTGSFASPAAGNPTVAMVEAAYRDLGLDARCINCDVAPPRLADAVRGARAMGFVGFNCSLPHKVAVIDPLDALATSAALIGLYPQLDAIPDLDLGSLRAGLIVADVIPNPPRTRLLQEAAARGCVTLDGLRMLVNQGLAGIELWTARRANPAVMRHTLGRIFGGA